jgi:hypothetical protein
VSAVVHEVLHVIGWMVFGRVPARAMAFRLTGRVMGFEARVLRPISAVAYRAGLAVPALVMGLLPALLGVL